MTITVVGDFADPLSFLASQRVEQIRSLGVHDVEWLAVEADRTSPLGGRPLEPALVERVRRLAASGETIRTAELLVSNSRAATSAYAESLTDGVPDAMRRALFDALWVHGRNIGDP
jgi:2-hydroxychromene-2-carboxylate isomerase